MNDPLHGDALQKKIALKNFAEFAVKHLNQGLYFNSLNAKVAKSIDWFLYDGNFCV